MAFHHATADITRNPSLDHTRVVVLSMYEMDEYVYGALRAGASGFLLKDCPPDELLDAVRRIHGGEALFAPAILGKLIGHYVNQPSLIIGTGSLEEPPGGLTPRETEVLTLVGQGFSNDEIISQLYISINTLKTHISSLLAKLHARDRAQLVIVAYRYGLVDPPR